MRFVLPCLALALPAAPAASQSVRLPEQVAGEPGTFVVVRPVQLDGKQVQWYSPNRALSVLPPELLKDSTVAVVIATKPGRFRLVAWTAKGDVPSAAAETLVVIGEPAPPGPTPPDPPGPGPAPPADPVLAELREALAKEPNTVGERALLLKEFTALYTHMAAAAGDVTLGDWGALWRHLSARASEKGLAGRFREVQGVLAARVFDILPREPQRPLDDAGRAQARAAFARAATLLEGLR